jgi:hypothetical protein
MTYQYRLFVHDMENNHVDGVVDVKQRAAGTSSGIAYGQYDLFPKNGWEILSAATNSKDELVLLLRKSS